jgi:phosphohistidine swiveling domain-containing protein
MMLYNNIYGKQIRDARKKQKQRLVDVAAPNAEIQAAIAKALNLSSEEISVLGRAAAIGRSKRPLIAPGSGQVVAVLMDEAMAIRLFGSLPTGSMLMPFMPQEKENTM